MYLVTGANGQLGSELKQILGDKAQYADVADLDITNTDAVIEFFAGKSFEAIINCAAYTAVDKAESDADIARKVNVDGPCNLAKTGVPIVHISTDYVFDGKAYMPYAEADKTNPQSVYGVTKLESEKAVMENASSCVIIRTAWLYSAFGNNFVKTMRKLGAERESLNVIFDQIGTPTYARDLAQVIADILPQMYGRKEIYHFSNEGVCSWYDFALEIMVLSGLKCNVLPIETKDYLTAAKRPHYSVLNKAKIKKDFGLEINHWKVSLSKCLEEM